MSASREKKQRKTGGEALTQRELKEQREAKADKRKKVVYWIAGIIVVIAVVALLVWNSGIFQRNSTAAVIGDHKLTVSEMQYYYNSARQTELSQQQMYAQYAMYGLNMFSDSYVQYDTKSSLGDQQVKDKTTGQTYAQYFKEQALSTAKRILSLSDAAKAAGYSLSAEAKKELDTSLTSLKEQVSKGGWSSFGAYLTTAYGTFVTESVFEAQQNLSALASEYYDSYSDSLAYDDAQLTAYAQENPADTYSYDYRMAYISGTAPSTTNDAGETVEATDEEKEAAKAAATEKANALVSGVKAASGDKSDAFNKLVVDAVGEDASYADPEKNLSTAVLGDTLRQQGASYYDWLASSERSPGDIEAIPAGDGYYVVLLLDRYLDNTATVDVRHILVKAELTQDDPATEDVNESATTPTEEQMQAAHDKAQAILDEYNAGDKTAEAFGALAEKYSDDGRAGDGVLNAPGGLYRYVVKGSMVPGFDEWIYDPARKSGDTGLVENNGDGGYYGWHVVYFQGEDGPKWHEVAENGLKSSDLKTWVEGLESGYTVTEQSGMSSVVK